jgi:hypothetical protein
MKRIAFAAILFALAISAGVKWTWAQPALQSGSDLLQILPDGDAVAVVDIQRLVSSEMWTAVATQSPLKGTIESVQNEMSKVGMKITDLQAAAFVFSSGFNDPTVAVSGAFNQSAVLAELRSKANTKVTSEKYKNLDLYNVAVTGQARNTSLAFLDQRTAVAGETAGVRAAIDNFTGGGKSSVAQNPDLAAALAQNPTSAIRFALKMTGGALGSIPSSELPLPDLSSVKLIFGGIDFTSGMDINATLRSDSADHARNIAERLNGLLGMGKAYFGSSSTDKKMMAIAGALNSITIVGSDVDVKITGVLPKEIFSLGLK